MPMRWLSLLLVAALAGAGCVGLGSDEEASQFWVPDPPQPRSDLGDRPLQVNDPSCPSDGLRNRTFKAAAFFLRNQEGAPVVLEAEGTFAGERGEVFFAVDPAERALEYRDTIDSFELRFKDQLYERSHDGKASYGRDLNPMGAFTHTYATFLAGEPEPDPYERLAFPDDLTVDAYEARCALRGETEAIIYTYDNGVDRVVLEADLDPPHRPLHLRVVDKALDDNFRASFSYDPPRIAVDITGSRMAPRFSYEVIAADQDGGALNAIIDEQTHWVPVGDIQLWLLTERGRVAWTADMDDDHSGIPAGNYFQYGDLDRDAVVSPGDTLRYEVKDGWELRFYDTWSKHYVTMPELVITA